MLRPMWKDFACKEFLAGQEALSVSRDQVPSIDQVNSSLAGRTGFQAIPVGGYLNPMRFFEALREGKFPTTVTIRGRDSLNFSRQPDIFHDIAGHVPLLMNEKFAEIVKKFGRIWSNIHDLYLSDGSSSSKLRSEIRGITRLFWFTVEFGLIEEAGEIKAYGSGILTSSGELRNALSSKVELCRFNLDSILNRSFTIDKYQRVLYIVDSLDSVTNALTDFEVKLRAGELAHLEDGEPFAESDNFYGLAGSEIVR